MAVTIPIQHDCTGMDRIDLDMTLPAGSSRARRGWVHPHCTGMDWTQHYLLVAAAHSRGWGIQVQQRRPEALPLVLLPHRQHVQRTRLRADQHLPAIAATSSLRARISTVAASARASWT